MNARLDPSSMTFEQPKHLKEVQYRRQVRKLGLGMIMLSAIVTLFTLLLYCINAWTNQPAPRRSWIIILAIGPLYWAVFRALLWFQLRSGRFLEFRNDRIFLSSKGEYSTWIINRWSLAPDALDPRITLLRISLSPFGIRRTELKAGKGGFLTTPFLLPGGARWSMLLDNPEEIARLREELSVRCPVRPR